MLLVNCAEKKRNDEITIKGRGHIIPDQRLEIVVMTNDSAEEATRGPDRPQVRDVTGQETGAVKEDVPAPGHQTMKDRGHVPPDPQMRGIG